MFPGINIYSGSKGLGAALTNPTCLSFRKGTIVNQYPIRYKGRVYPDAEAAFHAHKVFGDHAQQAELISQLFVCKLQQHRRLFDEIIKRGGVEWLATCSHHSGAKTPEYKYWEGDGLASPFIAAIVKGFKAELSRKQTETW